MSISIIAVQALCLLSAHEEDLKRRDFTVNAFALNE